MFLNTFENEPGIESPPQNSRMITAISSDGLRFEIESDLGLAGVATARIFSVDGGYRLYYPTFEGRPSPDKTQKILSSFSTDGLHFEREEAVRIEPLPGTRGVFGPTIFKLEDGRFRMLFHEDVTSSGRVSKGIIYGATSEDGLSWQRDDEPTLKPDENEREQVLHPFVLRYKEKYILFYNSHSRIFWADSKDGFVFERKGELGIRGADVDAILLENGKLRLYYGDFSPETGGVILSAILSPE
jgi:predicted GH43/DUF377 family glycosyl hydrolase